MIRFTAIAVVFAILVMVAVVVVSPTSAAAVDFYGRNVRASLFTGLLTTGSFLLSLKVFIVVKFKETVFDTAKYKERFDELRKYNSSLEHYAPVRDLSRVLFWSIATAIFASVSQVTVGLIPHVGALAFCVVVASIAAALLFQTLLLIRKIINDWLNETEYKPEAP